MKKKIQPLTDFCRFPFGPHHGQQLRHVPAIYLLSLVGTDELKAHPELAAYIERAKRQLNAEAKKEQARKNFHGD